MKFFVVAISALAGLAAAAAAPNAAPFDVDLTDVAAIVERDFPAEGLEKRAKCPSGQSCVGRRCVRVQCFPSGTTTTCTTTKYGNC